MEEKKKEEEEEEARILAWLHGRHRLAPPLSAHVLCVARGLAQEALKAASLEVEASKKAERQPAPAETLVFAAALRGYFASLNFSARGKGKPKAKGTKTKTKTNRAKERLSQRWRSDDG